jgi:hypothetical protein
LGKFQAGKKYPPSLVFIENEILMTKREETKLSEYIRALIGDDLKESDNILIEDLMDWIKINRKAKDELQESVKDGESMSWQTLTTIAMASKQIQNIMQRLNISPEKRARKQQQQHVKEGEDVDLNQLLG